MSRLEDFVVITGFSGAGKSQAMATFEDAGYFCVDNLPPEMIGSLDGVEWGVLFAATTVQLLPVLVFVVLCQRHLIEGLTAGATKG